MSGFSQLPPELTSTLTPAYRMVHRFRDFPRLPPLRRRWCQRPPRWEQRQLFIFPACLRTPVQSKLLENYIQVFTCVLWGSLMVMWGIRPRFFPEPRQSLMCITAERRIPPDSLICLCLPPMLFCIGIIGKQLDLLLVIYSPGLGKHGISLCGFMPCIHVSLQILLVCNGSLKWCHLPFKMQQLVFQEKPRCLH